MVFVIDRNLQHVAHVWRKTGIFSDQIAVFTLQGQTFYWNSYGFKCPNLIHAFQISGFVKVLDKMVLYLRIVHSVDFYNHSEYPNEDEMPNRSDLLKGYI